MKKFVLPTLYKKTSTGAIQRWDIWTEDNVIYTAYGQVDGKIQETSDIIHEGKNIGRSNETTAIEQAQAEAQSKWEKQLKKGYVKDKKDAEKGVVDEIIEGGIAPMLAHVYSKHGDKLQYPLYVSPKLDGTRMIAVVKNGKATLWTRSRKPINSLPHIVAELEKVFKYSSVILDGETYNEELSADFEKLVSLVRQDEPDKDCDLIQYHIFDIVDDNIYEDRLEELKELIPAKNKFLKVVESILVESEEEAMEYFEQCRARGYEGAMLRAIDGLYEHKRSYGLQKLKEFDDFEVDIIGFNEGRGKLAGHIGNFVCKTSKGVEFKAKLKGDLDRLKEMFDRPKLWQGKQLVVQYQGLTKDGVPRFPVGVRLRDDKDF